MARFSTAINAPWVARFRNFFTARDVIFHDGRDLRRFSVGGKAQAAVASVAAVTLCFSAYGVAQAAHGAAVAAGIIAPTTPEGKVIAMQAKLKAMKADVHEIKLAAKAHAATIEQRQQLIAAVLSGKLRPDQLAMQFAVDDAVSPALAADAVSPFRKVEKQQLSLAAQAQQSIQHRYDATASRLRKLGITPERLIGDKEGVGGPFEPVPASANTPEGRADAQFRSLFLTWKKLDSLEHSAIAIPSIHPLHEAELTFSSYFGIRTDPFNGRASMHPGVDLPGPVGTPVYATADGIVDRAGRDGGYGNMVEIDHGKGIQTRYGHLSKVLVSANTRVKRGQEIGLMGSTGRSTGSHLHYEVRIDGRAVNPMPFLQTADYLVALQDQASIQPAAMTGGVPESDD